MDPLSRVVADRDCRAPQDLCRTRILIGRGNPCKLHGFSCQVGRQLDAARGRSVAFGHVWCAENALPCPTTILAPSGCAYAGVLTGVIGEWCDYVADELSGGVILTHLDGEDDRMHRIPSSE